MITAQSGYFRTFRDLQLHIIGAADSKSYFSDEATDYMEEHTVIWQELGLMQSVGGDQIWITVLHAVVLTNDREVFQGYITLKYFR